MTTTTNRPSSGPVWKSNDLARQLTFAPLAWLKLQFLCHAGPTEVAAFGLASPDDPLYLEDVLVVRQRCTPVAVAFDDEAVADLFDRMVDAGIPPARFARVWLHTHPGASVTPSGTDEATFHRVFGGCDWAVMGILGRTGNTYARLRFNAGPGGSLILPVQVDWSAWPNVSPQLAEGLTEWAWEYHDHVEELLGSSWLESAFWMVGREHSDPLGVANFHERSEGESSPRRIAEMTDAEFARFDADGTVGSLHEPAFGAVDPITGEVHDFEDVAFEGFDAFR